MRSLTLAQRLCGRTLLFFMLALSAVQALAQASGGTPASGYLSLDQAVHLALSNDPQTAAVLYRAQAEQAAAVADSQWDDPALKFGVVNLPTDSFSFGQQPMTQKVVGISQKLPRGNSARLAAERGALRAESGFAAVADQELQLTLKVSNAYLSLAEQIDSKTLLLQNRRWLRELVDFNRARVASAQIQSQQLLQSQLALSRLDDSIGAIEGEINRARGELSRWLNGAAWGQISTDRPDWQATRNWLARQTLPVPLAIVEQHPAVAAAEALVEAEGREVAIAEQAYKPQWGIELSYGQRDITPMSDGSDFASAVVSVDLPLFRKNRQDQRFASARALESARIMQRQNLLQSLHAGLNGAVAMANTLATRRQQYQSELLNQADATAEAVLRSYASNTTELDTVILARMDAIESHLSALQLDYSYYRALAQIRYFRAEQADTAEQYK